MTSVCAVRATSCAICKDGVSTGNGQGSSEGNGRKGLIWPAATAAASGSPASSRAAASPRKSKRSKLAMDILGAISKDVGFEDDARVGSAGGDRTGREARRSEGVTVVYCGERDSAT